MSKVKEVELYQRLKSGKDHTRESFDPRLSTSAFICGERLKKAVKNYPEKDRTDSFVIVGGRKYNIDNLLFRIDLLNRENTMLCYQLFQLKGLEGLIKGMSSPRRNLEQAEKKVKPRKKYTKKNAS